MTEQNARQLLYTLAHTTKKGWTADDWTAYLTYCEYLGFVIAKTKKDK